MSYRSLAPSLLALFGATFIPTLSIQAQEGEAEPVGFERVTVDLVNVEVFVTDRDGNPVKDLRKEDFQVLEDGEPMTITNLFAVEPSGKPPKTAAPTGKNQLTSVILLVDNVDIRPAERNMALDDCQDFLENLLERPRTRAMIVTSGLNVALRQPLTDDREAILAALTEVRKGTVESIGLTGEAALLQQLTDRFSIRSDPGGMNAGGAPPANSGDGTGGTRAPAASSDFGQEDARAILEMTRSAARTTYERSRARLASLNHMISSLGTFPGRKLVLYVGTGLPVRPGEEQLRRAEASMRMGGGAPTFSADLEAHQYNLTPVYQEIVRSANSANVTFSSIEVGSDRGAAGSTAERFSAESDAGARGREIMSRQQSLQLLAQGTGGMNLVASGKLTEALERLVESLDTCYSLAYPAPGEGDGEYHEISVKVPRSKYRVRHRPGYVRKTVDQRMLDRSMAGLLFDVTPNPLGISLAAEPAMKADEDTYSVMVVVTVPLGQLMLVPNGTMHEANLSLWIAAQDGNERILQGPRQTFPLRVPNHKLLSVLGQTATYSFQLTVPAGEQKVAVTVRDDFSQTTATASTTFSVGPPSGGEGAGG